MRLDQALERIDASIIRQEDAEGRLSFYIRASVEGKHYDRWKATLEEFLLAHLESNQSWGQDVSRVYYATPNKAVKYVWRIVITGATKAAIDSGVGAFARAITRSLAVGSEVKSMPLHGQVKYEYDPAKGKTKGGHPVGSAGSVIAGTSKGP